MVDKKIDFSAIFIKMRYWFKDESLIENAIMHPGAVLKGRKKHRAYERYEFLGDRVLGLIIAEWLLEKFPNQQEGIIAKKFTTLVRKETLAKIIQKIGVDKDIILGQTQEKELRKNISLLADTMEAIIAAIFYDSGYESAKKFIKLHWEDELKQNSDKIIDAKSDLQEWLQARNYPLPNYEVIEISGPDHLPEFKIQINGKGFDPMIGTGSSKRLAEQDAANKVLKQIKSSEKAK